MTQMAEQLTLGCTIDRFCVTDFLGQGGESVVYKATDTVNNKTVVLKLLKQKEAKHFDDCKNVRSHYLAAIIEARKINGNSVVIEEFIDGCTLQELAEGFGDRNQQFTPETIRYILSDTARGLRSLHCLGLIHRDVKPDNIIVKGSGTTCLIDFGLVVAKDELVHVQPTEPTGTFLYMSPEHLLPPYAVEERSDLFGLGLVGYYLATGMHPHDAESIDKIIYKTLNEIPTEPVQLNPSLPKDLSDTLMCLLSKDVTQRCHSANELLRQLGIFSKLQRRCPYCKQRTAIFNRNCIVCHREISPIEVEYCETCGNKRAKQSCKECINYRNEKITACFVCELADSSHRIIPLVDGINSIGRTRLNSQDQTMSREHFTITYKKNHVCLQDNASHNGLYLNGKKCSESILQSSDCIEFGNAIGTFIQPKEL